MKVHTNSLALERISQKKDLSKAEKTHNGRAYALFTCLKERLIQLASIISATIQTLFRKCIFTKDMFISAEKEPIKYQVQLENDHVCVARVKIFPHAKIGLHRDAYPQVVIALQGGTITRLEADKREVDVVFPTGAPVFRPKDPENQLHCSINRSNKPLELIVIQLKKSVV